MNTLTDQQLARMREMFALFAVANKVVKKCNRVYEFTCPICGHTATAARAGNGHLYVDCDGCEVSMMQ